MPDAMGGSGGTKPRVVSSGTYIRYGKYSTPTKAKKRKGKAPNTQNYADPYGLVAAKMNASKIITYDAELGRYKPVDK